MLSITHTPPIHYMESAMCIHSSATLSAFQPTLHQRICIDFTERFLRPWAYVTCLTQYRQRLLRAIRNNSPFMNPPFSKV
jgi:hypothetical protein